MPAVSSANKLDCQLQSHNGSTLASVSSVWGTNELEEQQQIHNGSMDPVCLSPEGAGHGI